MELCHSEMRLWADIKNEGRKESNQGMERAVRARFDEKGVANSVTMAGNGSLDSKTHMGSRAQDLVTNFAGSATMKTLKLRRSRSFPNKIGVQKVRNPAVRSAHRFKRLYSQSAHKKQTQICRRKNGYPPKYVNNKTPQKQFYSDIYTINNTQIVVFFDLLDGVAAPLRLLPASLPSRPAPVQFPCYTNTSDPAIHGYS